MKKIIIADDEKTIRNGLARFVNWEDMGCTLSGVFSSGEEVLGYLKDNSADILLTDIVMDGISGLELIEEVLKLNKDIKTIILSGYDDFDYVKKALNLGAYDYLTKPVNLDELSACIAKINEKIDEETNNLTIRKSHDVFLEERFLNNLVRGGYDSWEAVAAAYPKAEQALSGENVCFARVYLKIKLNVKQKSDMIKELRQKMPENKGIFFFDSGINEFTSLFSDRENSGFVEFLRSELEKSIGEDKFCIGISPGCVRLCDYLDSFKKAGKVLEYRIISKNRQVLYYSEISEYMKGLTILGSDDEKNICRMLSQKDLGGLRGFIFELEDKESSADTKFVYDICIEVLLIINKYINENIEYESDFNEYTFSAIRNLLYKNSNDAIKDILSDYIDNAIEKISASESAGEHMLITKMKRYINEHYGEYITLETISKQVYAHPVYLSKLFREETGMNFIDYLTEVRINNAKELLKNPDCKIYDISYMVGYESSKHFSKVFKNATGMTPKEYREKITDV